MHNPDKSQLNICMLQLKEMLEYVMNRTPTGILRKLRQMKNRLKDLVILKTKKEIKRRGHQWEF